jgi:hypothetical protein
MKTQAPLRGSPPYKITITITIMITNKSIVGRASPTKSGSLGEDATTDG